MYGIAYRIKDSEVPNVLNHLDYREKGGYTRVQKLFFPQDPKVVPFEITIYIAHLNNVNFAGEADEDAIARQIVTSIGPSGPNIDYVRGLVEAMRKYFPGVNDEHLFSIEEKILQLTEQNNVR